MVPNIDTGVHGAPDPAAEAVRKSQQQLVAFKGGLQGFASSLQACYAQYDTDHELVVEMRSKVVRNTVLYRELHLQASKMFIINLKDFMSNYAALEYADFAECIEDIAADARSYNRQAKLVAQLHHSLYTDNQELVAEAQRAVQLLQVQLTELETEGKRFAAKSGRHNKKASNGNAATGILVIGSIALAPFTGGASLLGLAGAAGTGSYAEHHEQKEQAANARRNALQIRADNAGLAAEEIAGPMAQCVKQFSDAIATAAKFFTTISTQVEELNQQAQLAAKVSPLMAEEARRRIWRHHLKMRRPAKELMERCDAFLEVVPLIEADLARLADNDSVHRSYIQLWLEENEGKLRLIEALDEAEGQKNGWTMIKHWCPFITGKEDPNRPSSFWVDVIMDNIHGTGVLVQELSAQQMVNAAASFSETSSTGANSERFGSAGLHSGVNILGVSVGSKGMAGFKTAVSAAQRNTHGGQQKVQESLSRTVRLEAPPGKACKYRVTVRTKGGNVDAIHVKASKLASVSEAIGH